MIDAYISTRTSDFIDIRVISRSAEDISLYVDNVFYSNSTKALFDYSSSVQSLFFFKLSVKGLAPGYNYEFRIAQSRKYDITLKASTLEKPGGRFLCRFGILTDLHISAHRINRPDSGKRLYSKALLLAEKYLKRLEEQGAEFIVFPGDSLDPADGPGLEIFRELKEKSNIGFYPVIGNHEAWGQRDAENFNRLFCRGSEGFYFFDCNDIRFIMLGTPHQSSLDPDSPQGQWLLSQLANSARKKLLLFLHFSFVLHPCVQGFKNDGMQTLDHCDFWLNEFKKHKSLKIVFAGHKNVPSVFKKDHVYHLLSPQLFQAPCAYDLIELYEDGLIRSAFEIDEQDWLWQSRQAFSVEGWLERFGTPEHRNLTIDFD